MADVTVNPKVTTSIADLDGTRVKERADNDYTHNFWSTLKNGHYRFALAGIAVSIPISLAIGAVVSTLIGGALAPVVIPSFLAIGAMMGYNAFGEVGSAAASRAAGLAENNARILDAHARGKDMIAATDDKLMYGGNGHHYEFPPDRDRKKFFSWK